MALPKVVPLDPVGEMKTKMKQKYLRDTDHDGPQEHELRHFVE